MAQHLYNYTNVKFEVSQSFARYWGDEFLFEWNTLVDVCVILISSVVLRMILLIFFSRKLLSLKEAR